MSGSKHRIAVVLAVVAVIIGIALASEARLNRNEPHCRYWHPSTYACAEPGYALGDMPD